jgi:hypothetical protein
VAISQHGTSVLFTSHPQDGLVVYLYIPHNRRTPLQADEDLGPISSQEQVNFQWDDDKVHFVLDQHAELDFIVLTHWNDSPG